MMLQPSNDAQQRQMNQIMQFLPLMIVFFAWNYASGLAVYWVTSNIIMIIMQYLISGWGQLWTNPHSPCPRQMAARRRPPRPAPVPSPHPARTPKRVEPVAQPGPYRKSRAHLSRVMWPMARPVPVRWSGTRRGMDAGRRAGGRAPRERRNDERAAEPEHHGKCQDGGRGYRGGRTPARPGAGRDRCHCAQRGQQGFPRHGRRECANPGHAEGDLGPPHARDSSASAAARRCRIRRQSRTSSIHPFERIRSRSAALHAVARKRSIAGRHASHAPEHDRGAVLRASLPLSRLDRQWTSRGASDETRMSRTPLRGSTLLVAEVAVEVVRELMVRMGIDARATVRSTGNPVVIDITGDDWAADRPARRHASSLQYLVNAIVGKRVQQLVQGDRGRRALSHAPRGNTASLANRQASRVRQTTGDRPGPDAGRRAPRGPYGAAEQPMGGDEQRGRGA